MACPVSSVILDKLSNQGPQHPKLVGRVHRRQRIPHRLMGKYISMDPRSRTEEKGAAEKPVCCCFKEVNSHLKYLGAFFEVVGEGILVISCS